MHHREKSIDVNEWLAHVTRHDAASPLAQRVRRSQRIYTSMSGRQRRWRCRRRPCSFASRTASGAIIPSHFAARRCLWETGRRILMPLVCPPDRSPDSAHEDARRVMKLGIGCTTSACSYRPTCLRPSHECSTRYDRAHRWLSRLRRGTDANADGRTFGVDDCPGLRTAWVADRWQYRLHAVRLVRRCAT